MQGQALIAVTLGTQANATVIKNDNADASDIKTFAISLHGTWTKRNGTIGEGPLMVGVAHSDYSAAEIEEWIEASNSWDQGDLVAQEVAKRKIRRVGAFSGDTVEETLNDGRVIKTPLKWLLNAGDTISVWVYSRVGSTLTTGVNVIMDGIVWLRPTS